MPSANRGDNGICARVARYRLSYTRVYERCLRGLSRLVRRVSIGRVYAELRDARILARALAPAHATSA
jgi:hypothetical protein